MKKHLIVFLLGLSFVSLGGCKGETNSLPFEIQYSVTKEPTCTEKGREEGYDESSSLVSRDIPALGHNYGDGVVTKEATCEGNGEKTYTCSRCHETKTETLEPLGHQVSSEYAHDDKKHYQTCSRCNKHFNESVHNFQFKSQTNLEPRYYFPENYYYVSDYLKPTFGYDENGTEIMGSVNEYACPTCNETFYKAEFITSYTKNYSTDASAYDTGYKNEFTYEYSDYKIKSVTQKVIDEDNNANTTCALYEYLYTDTSMTITRYNVSADGNTKTPWLKAVLTLDANNRATKIDHYYYHSSNGQWGDRYDWYEFTYNDEGKVIKTKQDYLSSFYVECTWFNHDSCNEIFAPLKAETFKNDGTLLSTEEYTYDESGKVLKKVFTNNESGSVTTRNYTYDSKGRLLSNGVYKYEYYDGDSYRYYLGTTLQKDVKVNSDGEITKQTDYYDTLTVIYELLNSSSNANEAIKSTKKTYDYNDDDRDYVVNDYLKSTFTNGLKTHVYEKVQVEYGTQSYLNSNSTNEINIDYSYTNRNFLSKKESKSKSVYTHEDRNDLNVSTKEEYTFTEFSISKNVAANVM